DRPRGQAAGAEVLRREPGEGAGALDQWRRSNRASSPHARLRARGVRGPRAKTRVWARKGIGMHLRGFLRAGHTPTLCCAFLYFDISFMVWVLLGALANSIAPELELDAAERGLMVAVPLLGGAVLRLVLGVMTDHIGARRTALCGLVLTLAPLLLGWLWA